MDQQENILNQIEKIKNDLDQLQTQLENEKVYGKEQHGLVTTIVNGKGEVIDFEFDSGMVDIEFKKAIIQSINNGLKKARQLEKKQKQKIANGISIPDMPDLF